jgi:hypothetical protein
MDFRQKPKKILDKFLGLIILSAEWKYQSSIAK